jgi:hypothetical protein
MQVNCIRFDLANVKAYEYVQMFLRGRNKNTSIICAMNICLYALDNVLPLFSFFGSTSQFRP